MTSNHSRNTRLMLSSPRCGSENKVRQALHVSRGEREKTVPDAWRGFWIRRPSRQ